jgi:hypothetical protein
MYGGLGYSQPYNECIAKILEITDKKILPFETKKIDKRNIKELKNNLVISGILNNDSSKFYYIFRYYDNDKQENAKELLTYRFYTIAKLNIENLLLFVYMKVGNDSLSIILSTYYELKYIDSICIGFEEGGGDTEMMKYKESIITENLEIKTRYYEWNPEYIDKKTRKNPNTPKTIVTLTDYKIDENSGKILLIKQEKKYSNCIPEEFSYPETSCNIFDKP